MRLRQICIAIPTLLAVLAIASAADPVTYDFSGTTTPSYSNSVEIAGGWNFSGSFTMNGNTVTAYSFDLSNGINVPNNCCNTGTDTLQAVDNNGGYVLDSSFGYSSVFPNINGWAYEIGFDADAAVKSGANPNVTTVLAMNLSSLGPGGFGEGEIVQYVAGTGSSIYEIGIESGNISVVTPEPPSWTLLGAGGLLLAGFALWSDRRRRAGCQSPNVI